ncbi:DNA polymerase III subunit gamma/tau [Helicobacter baculiformis]|uniref:DNA polymerase III subunit gamma/tau n=1 Tax=Helicobacter baculiformis TaxID=427351 RepID=A0ABV7ZJA1_9HELI|nr:DNA polymerase III subunit gamma/tau [Helicobacter baculiformis]
MVLALKYRPQHFKDLVGQESVSQTLSLALEQGRLAHAYLFSGLRGSGKTSSARIFARALQCSKAPTSTPCDVCINCVDALQNKHMDIVEMDGASHRRIEDVRELIEQTKYKPGMGAFKIFIIDEAHMLTKEAFNALLKTLEEPPAHVKFILATTDALKLPATILSRTQHFRFKKIAPKAIVAHLQKVLEAEGVIYQEGVLEMLARSAQGSLRDTLTLTEQAISYCNANLTLEATAQMLGMVDSKVLNDFFQAIESDPARARALLQTLSSYDPQMILEEMAIFLKDALLEERFSIPLLDRWMGILAQAKSLLYTGADGDFVLALSALKMQATQTPQAPSKASTERTLQPPTPQLPTPKATQTNPTPKELFSQLIAKLYAHQQELGALFEKHIRFHDFQNKTLQWQSDAPPDTREVLKTHYPIILQSVQEIYGSGVEIQAVKIAPPSAPAQLAQGEQDIVGAVQEHLGIVQIKVEKS